MKPIFIIIRNLISFQVFLRNKQSCVKNIQTEGAHGEGGVDAAEGRLHQELEEEFVSAECYAVADPGAVMVHF